MFSPWNTRIKPHLVQRRPTLRAEPLPRILRPERHPSSKTPQEQRRSEGGDGEPSGPAQPVPEPVVPGGRGPCEGVPHGRASALIKSHKAPGIVLNKRRRDPNPTLAATPKPHKEPAPVPSPRFPTQSQAKPLLGAKRSAVHPHQSPRCPPLDIHLHRRRRPRGPLPRWSLRELSQPP